MDSFNVFEFFNSKDIAGHCKNIGHTFTAIETAYLIWYSDHHTIAQKHTAWKHIIKTMPNEEITQFDSFSSMMLHEFLQEYMDTEQAFVDNFTTFFGEIQHLSGIKPCLIHQKANFQKATALHQKA